ncbi:MAG TPA: ATP synthase F1 subunit epsilon [Pirellulales bacterium]|nr:ATP synthase F1 subunit epsilon [Pirellulales bacterium]
MEVHEKAGTHGHALQLVVVTPEATVLEETAEFVALPLFDGEIGIAPLHSPMIGRLGFGEMRIKRQGRIERYYVDGGFVQVIDDVVSVLTGRAVPAANLKAKVAEEQLAEARQRVANTPETLALRERAEQQARAQLRVARHAGV